MIYIIRSVRRSITRVVNKEGTLPGTLPGEGQTLRQIMVAIAMATVLTYTWGTGAHTDRLTINIGAVPEPSTLVLSSIAAIAGLGAWARKRVDRRADGACGPAGLM